MELFADSLVPTSSKIPSAPLGKGEVRSEGRGAGRGEGKGEVWSEKKWGSVEVMTAGDLHHQWRS